MIYEAGTGIHRSINSHTGKNDCERNIPTAMIDRFNPGTLDAANREFSVFRFEVKQSIEKRRCFEKHDRSDDRVESLYWKTVDKAKYPCLWEVLE